MNIVSHISHLLYMHDCVILPGFGGLVTNYSPARINHVHQTFYPPSKSLSFNSNLRNNDGLLATHISQNENIPYSEALTIVEDFVSECRKELLENGKLTFASVGVFVLNFEGKTEFEPFSETNYLSDAYGLSSFSLSILRSGQEKQQEKPKLTETRKTPVIINWNRILRLSLPAAAVIVIALFVWISRPYMGSLSNLASLWPFSNSEKPAVDPKQPDNKQVPEIDNYEANPDLSVSEVPAKNSESDTNTDELADNHISSDLNNPPPQEIENQTEQENPTSYESSSDSPASQMPFHIIGGSFGSLANARKAAEEFIDKGYNASVLEIPVNGFYRVSLFSTSERREADAMLSGIREEINPAAWILVK